MTKINLKKTRWVKFFYEIQKEYELSAQQTLIYGYLYNHCQYLNDNGYIGYSDERMSKELNISYERFRKELYILRKKELIIIKNPGKKTKKTGESRMIYINTLIFLEEEQLSLTDVELDNAKKKIEKLENQIKELTAELSRAKKFGNAFTQRIEHSKVIPDNQVEDMHRILAPVYEALANEYTYKEISTHIDYVINQIKQRDVKKPISYLVKAADKYEHKPDASRLAGTVSDPDFGSNTDEVVEDEIQENKNKAETTLPMTQEEWDELFSGLGD